MIQSREEIAELAEFIAEENISRGKTNLEKIAHSEDISFSYGNYSDYFLGLLEYENSGFHVFINLDKLKNPKYERTRFTFAHELGHYFIDHHRNTLKSGQSLSYDKDLSFVTNNPIEQEANHFATHLLMPKERFMKQALNQEIGINNVMELAKQFKTSITATAIHFQNIVEHPCGLLFWDKDRNFKRKKNSQALFNLVNGSGKTFAINEIIKGEIFEGFDSIFSFDDPTSISTKLSSFYPEIHSLGKNDLSIKVETVSLKSHGYVSLIFTY